MAAFEEFSLGGGATIDVTVDKPKVKTRAQKLTEWRKANQAAYKKACDDNCTCTPTRAQMLLIQQWDNGGPADL